jgi:hypothetical protein
MVSIKLYHFGKKNQMMLVSFLICFYPPERKKDDASISPPKPKLSIKVQTQKVK